MNNLSINKEREIEATKNTLWTILTEPNFIKQWLGVRVETDWNEGSPITFSFTWDGKEFEDKGHLLKFEQLDTFSYDYWSGFSGMADLPENYSIITFKLNDQIGKTILQLTHSNFSNQTMYEHSDKNWEETMDTIKKLAEENR